MDKEIEHTETVVPSETESKTKQRKLFLALVGSIVVLLMILIINWATKSSTPAVESVSKTAPVYDVSRQMADKSYWMYKSEQVLKNQTKTQENLQKQVEALETKLSEPPKKTDLNSLEEQDKLINAIIERLEQRKLSSSQTDLQTDTHTTPQQQWTKPMDTHFRGQGANVKDNHTSGMSSSMTNNTSRKRIFSEKLMLAPKPIDPKSQMPHIDHYIPVGTFARAVLLNGVDVSVGLSAQQNPQPILLRLVDKGNLPNGAVGDMKDCRIIGAAHGDYSSERALVRIEKLSCVQKDNSVIETDVGGFVVGTDGKAGIRGPMITRDGELLAQGFISGLFSGLGKAASSATGTSSVTPFGTVNTLKGKEVLMKAGSEGTGSAFELLSRYAIKRLEQLQPIIQISANREVDIVFHTGSKFGERKERAKEKRSQEPSQDIKIGDFLPDN